VKGVPRPFKTEEKKRNAKSHANRSPKAGGGENPKSEKWGSKETGQSPHSPTTEKENAPTGNKKSGYQNKTKGSSVLDHSLQKGGEYPGTCSHHGPAGRELLRDPSGDLCPALEKGGMTGGGKRLRNWEGQRGGTVL